MNNKIYLIFISVFGILFLLIPTDLCADDSQVENLKKMKTLFEKYEGYSGDPVVNEFKQLGLKAVEFLAGQLENNKSSIKRKDAISALRSMGSGFTRTDKALPSIIKALNDPNEDVRSSAAGALGDLGPLALPAVSSLVSLIEERGPQINAVWALGRIGQAANTAIPVLYEYVNLTSGREYIYLAEAIMKIEGVSEKIVLILLKALNDEDEHARSEAVHALRIAKRESNIVIPSLITLLHDPNDWVSFRAASVLADLDPQNDEIIPVLTSLIEKGRPLLSYFAAMRLAHIQPESKIIIVGYKKALDYYYHAPHSPTLYEVACFLGEKGLYANEVLPVLRKIIEDNNVHWKLKAIESLIFLSKEHKVALEILKIAEDDKNEQINQKVKKAIKK